MDLHNDNVYIRKKMKNSLNEIQRCDTCIYSITSSMSMDIMGTLIIVPIWICKRFPISCRKSPYDYCHEYKSVLNKETKR